MVAIPIRTWVYRHEIEPQGLVLQGSSQESSPDAPTSHDFCCKKAEIRIREALLPPLIRSCAKNTVRIKTNLCIFFF